MADQALGTSSAARTPGDGSREVMHLPPSAPPRNHGRTLAAWTTTAVVLAGAVLAAVGVVVSLPVLAWVGAGVDVRGLVVGATMAAMGYGQPGARDAARRGHGTAPAPTDR